MEIKLTNGNRYEITLEMWDGTQWLPDCAGDVLAGSIFEDEDDLDWLVIDLEAFNEGAELDWLQHSANCQEVYWKIRMIED